MIVGFIWSSSIISVSITPSKYKIFQLHSPTDGVVLVVYCAFCATFNLVIKVTVLGIWVASPELGLLLLSVRMKSSVSESDFA